MRGRCYLAVPLMGKTPAEILESAAGFDDFRKNIIALKGNFPLDQEDMLRLGELYFRRYPDTYPDRVMENVHAGYRIVRICLVEKILEGIGELHRDAVRAMLEDFRLIDDSVTRLQREIGIEELEGMAYIIECNLGRIRNVIDQLPKGMIKERFVGGISKFYNDAYLLKEAIAKMKRG